MAAKQAAFGYAILFPTLAILFIFRFLPMLEAFVISFSKYDLIHPAQFIGFANFVDLVQDPLFRNSARVSLIYVVFSVLPVWPLSLGLAVLFNRSLFLKNMLRSAVFMPVVMPAVVMAVVWTFMYQQDGVLNTILGWVGIDPIPWLRSSSTALPAVILIGIWRATPYYMVIFLAGLQAIPTEYYEAAEIDGASRWSSFWDITLPLLKPTTSAGHGDDRDRGDEGVCRADDHDRGRAVGFHAGAATVHLPDGVRVLRHGPGRGNERVPVRRRHAVLRRADPHLHAGRGLRCGTLLHRSGRHPGTEAKPAKSFVHRAVRHRGDVLAHVLVLGAVAISLLPYYWMVSSSLRTMTNMFRVPIQWIPDPVNWRSYVLAWHAQDFTRYFFNSGVVAVAITLGNLLLCSLAGYSLAKFRYFGRGLLFILILSTMMLPLEVTMVPLFLIIKRLDWANSYQGLIVPFLVDGFGVFLMRQYMLGIPKGSDRFGADRRRLGIRIFWQIVLPLCKPALVALGVFTFREAWDMYIWPLIIVSKDSLRTLPLAISLFMSSYGTAWDQLMAIAVLGTLPMIILFFLLQRAFIQGIAVTGLKE
jgi:multiple sugar transport system permease protein